MDDNNSSEKLPGCRSNSNGRPDANNNIANLNVSDLLLAQQQEEAMHQVRLAANINVLMSANNIFSPQTNHSSLTNAALLQSAFAREQRVQALLAARLNAINTTTDPIIHSTNNSMTSSMMQNVLREHSNRHSLPDHHQISPQTNPTMLQQNIFSRNEMIGSMRPTLQPSIVGLAAAASTGTPTRHDLSLAAAHSLDGTGGLGQTRIHPVIGQGQDIPSLQQQLSSISSSPLPKPKKGRPAKFLEALYRMLLDLEKVPDGPSVATFAPHGRSFFILKPDKLVDHVLSQYFRMNNIASFKRQLNMYGFRQVSMGVEKGAYYNKYFIRGQPQLLTMIQRATCKKKGTNSSDETNEQE